MEGYAQRYMAFMSECKTEREATAWAVREAEKLGYKPFAPGMGNQARRQNLLQQPQ